VKKSLVESYFISQSPVGFLEKNYERVPVLCVANYITLGQVAALRFLEWVSDHPEGVVSLPTGKTPEFFIKWMKYYLDNWDMERDKGLLSKIGIKSPRPDFGGLFFVQMDEIFPMSPDFERSFNKYVRDYYIDGFGFAPEKVMLIDGSTVPESCRSEGESIEALFGGPVDLSIREKKPSSHHEWIQKEIIKHHDQFCEAYEKRIRELGGVDFFLGGIGPDGHVAFNMKGASHYSCTRLTQMNYETAAAAATDLGGIENARMKAVITIGLQTICYNPDAVVIIMAAGEAKAGVVAKAIEPEAGIDAPGSSLQKLDGARFYLTEGASSGLRERNRRNVLGIEGKSEDAVDRIVIDQCLDQKIKIDIAAREPDDYQKQFYYLKDFDAKKVFGKLYRKLVNELEKGTEVPDDQTILHTAPHHDDIELAYFPLLHHLVRSRHNKNYFSYLTSGYTAVTNTYVLDRLVRLKRVLENGDLNREIPIRELVRSDSGETEIHGYLNAGADQDSHLQDIFYSARLCRRLAGLLNENSGEDLRTLIDSCIKNIGDLSPGAFNPESIRLIKTWIREWEAELVWAHFGIDMENISHLRLGFYSDRIFPGSPEFKQDVVPIIDLIKRTQPTIITLALDPEGTGPDTHYKTLLALRQAIGNCRSFLDTDNLKIWGYRNIWSRFHISEANKLVPLSLNSFAVLHNMFNTCYLSQKSASFPSFEYDGPFNQLAQKIWVSQFQDLISLLGAEAFYNHPNPMMRRAYGAIYIKEMSFDEFMNETEGLTELAQGLSQFSN
jgi:glucosamine-6-phosphate deaminase